MKLPANKTILSGVQPSGTIHIGNYLGALKQWVELQENNTTYFCIVDEHAITVEYDPKTLPERVLDAAAIYIAAGIDPEKSIIFVQSHIPAHTELSWLLGTVTRLGELRRMTQFKEKTLRQAQGKKNQKTEASLGLFAYPVLQAADILLYNANLVPVGEDQVQHVELTRDIAKRFNNTFGEVFIIPKAFVNKQTARIMSLTDPANKMSKSDNKKSYIALTDSPDDIRKKIMSAVTETDSVFSFSKSGPAVQNLLGMYKVLGNKDEQEIESQFEGKGYKDFKEALAELIIETLTPIRERYKKLRQDDEELQVILGRGTQQAQSVANETLRKVKQAMGLV